MGNRYLSTPWQCPFSTHGGQNHDGVERTRDSNGTGFMMMTEGYWFRSSAFQIEPGEDENVNPGIYGRQLALWLKQRLENRGQTVLDVFPEDFGWCVQCQFKPFPLWVGCGSINDRKPFEDLPGSDQVTWHCFAVAELPLLGRLFRRHDMAPALSRLDQLLRDILESDAAISFVGEP